MTTSLSPADVAALRAFIADRTLWSLWDRDDVASEVKTAVADSYQARAEMWRGRAERRKGAALQAELQAVIDAADRLAQVADRRAKLMSVLVWLALAFLGASGRCWLDFSLVARWREGKYVMCVCIT